MLKLSPLLGVNSPVLGKTNPLNKPSILYREPKIASAQLVRTHILPILSPLIRTFRFLSGASPDRLHYSNKQSEIGWDNWRPIDRSSDRDDFDYKVDRSRFNSIDRSSQTNQLENPELDFFTTILPTEFAEIDPQLDSLPTSSIDDVEIPTPTATDRSTADTIHPQSPGELQPKPIEPDRKLLASTQIDRLEQPKSTVQASRASANIQPPLIPKTSSEIVGKNTILSESESSIGLLLDSLALNTVDGSPLEPLSETSINLNLDSTQSPEPDLIQISRSIVDGAALQENQIASNLAAPPELIPDRIVPNLLASTTINPAISPQLAPLEPEVKTTIIPESTVSPENITPFTVLEQIATATEITPIPESSDRLRADRIVTNSLDLLTVIDPKLPEVATSQLPQLEQISTATENIPSVIPLAIESVSESSSDTLPGERSDSPIIDLPPSIDTAQVTLDELAIANLDVPALTSALPSEDLNLTTSPLLADPEQIATAPNQIPPEIQSPQQLNPATAQLNLAADLSNIDRDSAPSIQLEPVNSNIPESSNSLPAAALPTNLLPIPTPEQIPTSPISVETEADLPSTQLVSANTSQLNLLNPAAANPAPSALEQISRFTDEQTPVNLEIPPISIVESSPTLNLDSPQSSVDRSLQENISLESTSIIALEQENKENITELSPEFSTDKSVASPLGNRLVINQPIADSPQNTEQLKHLPVDIIDESDNVISPSDNPIDNLISAIEVDSLTTALPTIGQTELSSTSIDINADNSSDIIIPAPTVGYATGGSVKDANHIDLQSIASSDTVSAMLTPGEFVINAKDAQKNLDLLTHINRGGEPESALPSTEIQPSIIEFPPTSTAISPTSIQRKRNDSIISPSLQRDIGLQQLSPLTNPGLNPSQSSQTESSNSSPTYSSPSMVFRKPISSPQAPYIGTDTPDRWGSIEDLINGGSNNSDTFSFENISPQSLDIESRSSPRISPQYTSPIKGFADGGEVTPSDISTTIEPITQTIESPINNPQPEPENNDPAELEILAREIYHRLRQRLEIERERHGSYSGNLAW
jgi:hypothetical protein